MKKLWLAPVLGLALAGCDGLLEENPVSTITPQNFFQNATDALTALSGAYQVLHHGNYVTGREYVFMLETPTPQIVSYAGTSDIRGQFDIFDHSPNNGYILDSWRAIYQGINDANVVIDNVPGIESMQAGLRERIVAEAKFLRALHYFNAVRLWGGVPLRVNETSSIKEDLEQPRATANEVYNQIIKDLTEAAAVLPASYPASEFGRATKGAAQSLLGKVYLQRAVAGKSNPFGDPKFWPQAEAGDLQKAEQALRAVVQSGQYSLVPEYSMLWNEATEMNSEVVFAVQNTTFNGQGMTVNHFLAPRNSGWLNTWTSAGVELPFWQSYAEEDERRDVTWIPEYTEVKGKKNVFTPSAYNPQWPTPSLRKYLIERRDIGGWAVNPRDLHLLRYADVLLMLAEVLVEQGNTGEALPLVNQVRTRAGVAPLASVNREAIYWERNWELASEQHAWYDSQRFWDLFSRHAERHADLTDELGRNQVPKVDFEIQDPKHRLMPIPQEVLDRNRELTQNPEW
jgi:hypothetical protein